MSLWLENYLGGNIKLFARGEYFTHLSAQVNKEVGKGVKLILRRITDAYIWQAAVNRDTTPNFRGKTERSPYMRVP